jgi:rare lipoprotein A
MILFRRLPTSVLPTLLFLLLTLLSFPTLANNPTTKPSTAKTTAATTVLRGRASWYGREFQGRRTTSGERYNRFQYTCAHKTLPFGTRLRVTNPSNGKSVVVRVSDRGPFRAQRIIDLSEVAAKPLQIICCGSASVIAEVVPATTPLGPTETPDNLLALQAADPSPEAAFTTYIMPAVELAIATDSVATAAVVIPATLGTPVAEVSPVFIVQAGTFADVNNAQAMLAKIESLDPTLQVRLSAENISGRIMNRVLIGYFADRPEAEAVRRRIRVWGIGGLVRDLASM